MTPRHSIPTCKIQCTLNPVGELYNGPNEENSDEQPPIAPVAAQRSPAQSKYDKGIRHHEEQHRVGIGGGLGMNNHPDDDLRGEQRHPGENKTNNDPKCIHRRPPLAVSMGSWVATLTIGDRPVRHTSSPTFRGSRDCRSQAPAGPTAAFVSHLFVRAYDSRPER